MLSNRFVNYTITDDGFMDRFQNSKEKSSWSETADFSAKICDAMVDGRAALANGLLTDGASKPRTLDVAGSATTGDSVGASTNGAIGIDVGVSSAIGCSMNGPFVMPGRMVPIS